MSHCSFAQAYHPNCLADYEKLQHKMDHYQIHTHSIPTAPHATGIHTISSWTPKLQWPKDWQHMNLTHNHPAHHFHFPAMSIHDLTSKVENIGHLAQPPGSVPIAAIAPWVPDADIRETKHAYHIEIEVPGVTDKGAMVIQWLERRTLLVRGEIQRPHLEHATKAETKVDEESSPDAVKTPEVDQSTLPAVAAETNTDSARTAKPVSAWEKLDMDWCELTQTHEKDKLTNGNTLNRVLSGEEQELAREVSTELPTFLLSERKVGMWQRTFTLPLDADMKGLRASLRGGLLVIELPKRDMTGEPKWEINIGQ